MTVLAAATGVSQKQGLAGDWEFCFEADAVSLADDNGTPRPESQAVDWMHAHGFDLSKGTTIEAGMAYLAANGFPNHFVKGDASIDAGLGRMHNLLWVVSSDGRGNINGSRHTQHFVRTFGHDAAGVHLMNSLGDPVFGQNHVIPDATFFANSCGYGIEIDVVLAKDQGGEAMTDDERKWVQGIGDAINALEKNVNALKADFARAIVGLEYLTLDGSEPSYPDLDYEVGTVEKPGKVLTGEISMEGQVHNLADNDPTMKNNLGKLRKFYVTAGT